jgi:F-type H+-transporting ATPase subunit a
LIVTRLVTGILADFDPLRQVMPVPLFTFYIGHWSIVVSNHMFMVSLGMLMLLIFMPLVSRSKGMVPKGAKNLVESICLFLREEMARPVLGENTDRYIGFIWTLFFFILSLNLLGMVPFEKIVMLLTGKENHFGGAATANIWITGTMAIVTFFMTHIAGIRRQGFRRYIVNFAPPVPLWIMPLIYLLEIIAALVRPFTLAVRLFANMVAGHIVLAAILGLILLFKSYGAAIPVLLGDVALSFLELLVALIQAYIFTLLSTLYISFSVSSEHY